MYTNDESLRSLLKHEEIISHRLSNDELKSRLIKKRIFQAQLSKLMTLDDLMLQLFQPQTINNYQTIYQKFHIKTNLIIFVISFS